MRRLASGLATLGCAALVGCGSDGGHPVADEQSNATAAFTDGGVHVALSLGTGERPELVARFRPVKAGFHVYSAHLPVGGVQGLGQRTSVQPAGALRAAGPLRMSAPVHDLLIKPLHLTLPVYPNGPVTARMTVRRAGAGPSRVLVSYAACSDRVCYPPVKNHVVDLG